MNKGKQDFAIGVTLEMANSISAMGDGISYAGYTLTATGVGAELGVPMVILGGTISSVGNAADGLIDLAQGKTKLGVYKLGTSVVGTTIGFGVEGMLKAGKLSQSEFLITQGIFDVKTSVLDGVMGLGLDK